MAALLDVGYGSPCLGFYQPAFFTDDESVVPTPNFPDEAWDFTSYEWNDGYFGDANYFGYLVSTNNSGIVVGSMPNLPDAQAYTAMVSVSYAWGVPITLFVHRKTGAPYFIDKMPNNFAHIGLIRLMLPNAKIIDARRHPVACCFSAFKQHFAVGQAFSYGLGDLARYYRDYLDLMAHFDAVLPGAVHRVIYETLVAEPEAEVRRLLAHDLAELGRYHRRYRQLMAHWRRVLPAGRILDVRYEDVVADLEPQVRRILDFCGLPFEDACLRFHETQRAVRTASSEQVRRPIFTDATDHWRRFEPWLEPLIRDLSPVLGTYPDPPKL